ncbi:hypothetical protein DFH07DRAFT_776823 [Mycena maculata]|uniref:Uncharacterized protein n=1 Tax=Mycena maculata TaxID=230809 RepID=A0AAD7IKE4_9AGAR|nr:hypothetical protein DFH07DRAFT_776823 [Mycena maculata]
MDIIITVVLLLSMLLRDISATAGVEPFAGATYISVNTGPAGIGNRNGSSPVGTTQVHSDYPTIDMVSSYLDLSILYGGSEDEVDMAELPFLFPIPAGPVFTETYVAPANGSTPAMADMSLSSMDSSRTTVMMMSISGVSTHKLSRAKTTAEVLLPLFFLILLGLVYLKIKKYFQEKSIYRDPKKKIQDQKYIFLGAQKNISRDMRIYFEWKNVLRSLKLYYGVSDC